MAQERGHAHQVGPRIESMLAEAVTERVGCDSLEASQAGVLGDEQLDRSGADALPALTDEEMIIGDRWAHVAVGIDRLAGIAIEWQDPELAALPRTDGQ